MERKGKFIFTLYAYVFMIGFAVSGTMFSSVLPRIIEDYNLTFSQAGLFSVFSNAGNLLAMAVTGILGDRYRKSVLLGIVFAGLSATLALVGLALPFALFLGLQTLLGCSSSIINLLVTAFVSDLYGKERARYINLAHMFFGIGSLAGPAYPVILQHFGFGWEHSYIFLAAAVLVISVSYFVILLKIKEPVTPKKHTDEGAAFKGQKERMLLKHQGMLALCIMSFIYMGGHQNTFSTWFQTYLQTEDPKIYTEGFTSMCMTMYWIGMVISRTVSASFSKKMLPRTFLLAGSMGGTIVLTAGMVVQAPGVWCVSAFLLGICTGAVYPLIFAVSCEWFPDSSARAASMVGIFTSLGSMLGGWLVGKIAGVVSFFWAMFIPWSSLLLVFAIVWRCFPGKKADTRH